MQIADFFEHNDHNFDNKSFTTKKAWIQSAKSICKLISIINGIPIVSSGLLFLVSHAVYPLLDILASADLMG